MLNKNFANVSGSSVNNSFLSTYSISGFLNNIIYYHIVYISKILVLNSFYLLIYYFNCVFFIFLFVLTDSMLLIVTNFF